MVKEYEGEQRSRQRNNERQEESEVKQVSSSQCTGKTGCRG
jgi:hypothetical protein